MIAWEKRDRIEDEACGNSLIGYLLNIIAWHSLSNDPIFANETKGGHCIKNHQGSCTPSVYPGEYVCSWLKSSLVTCEQALRGSPVAGQEKEVELATISLEIFEYLHRKCQCKMLIGRDDISKDVITLGACLHVFFNVCSHSCWFPLCADWWKSDSSVDVKLEAEFKFERHKCVCKLSLLFSALVPKAPECLLTGYLCDF